MKLISIYTPSHEQLKDEWFLATLQDDYELDIQRSEVLGHGNFLEQDWTEAVLFKSQRIVDAIVENWGQILVYADVDIQFFAPTRGRILAAMAENDIVCQLDDPAGNLCTGFFALRANDLTLRLWQDVQQAIPFEHRDQYAFNRIIRGMTGIRFGYLPLEFFGGGTFNPLIWKKGGRCFIPYSPIMHHANWTVGVDNKIESLREIREIVKIGNLAIVANNLAFYCRYGMDGPRTAKNFRRYGNSLKSPKADTFTNPRNVCLDASNVCQLKCPACPTSLGIIGQVFGRGLLRFDDFRKFLNDHPWISTVELSKWGEIFLNPELKKIIEYAFQQHILLRVDNGANLNHVTDEVLEALVKYKVRSLTCSIDGASQETYATYRVNGNFDVVIENICKINAFKRKHRLPYPALRWQFVAFGHNQHEIAKARSWAQELGMSFYLKLNWDDLYTASCSPVEDRELIREESGLGVADRKEYEEKFGRHFVNDTCHQLWLAPRINFDGKLLGCCINHWGCFADGNVFEEGLENCLKEEKIAYAKEMLLGLREAKEGIPCTQCEVYQCRRQHSSWVSLEVLQGSGC